MQPPYLQHERYVARVTALHGQGIGVLSILLHYLGTIPANEKRGLKLDGPKGKLEGRVVFMKKY